MPLPHPVILRAQGYAESLTQIYGAAKGIDAKTMTLQYLDTLKTIGNSPSTKYIIPAEFTDLLKPLRSLMGEEDTKG